MTPLARRQLLQALHPHYRSAPRAGKTQILDTFATATGYHRKYALGLLRHGPPSPRRPRQGRLRYDAPVVEALQRVWTLSGGLCSKRLAPFLPALLEALERHGEIRLAPTIRQRLLLMSPATIDRKLAPYRRLKLRGRTTTRPGALLKQHIPVRTFAQWNDLRPGFTEIDLVAHCGESAHGEFVQTLSLVDIATVWFEAQAVPTRSQRAVFAALTTIQARLPFPLRGIDSDNDSAFINAHLLQYCQRQRLTFTRSRTYTKNDQAHVEERNGMVIRRLIGYDRYEGDRAAQTLNRVYETLRLWTNFFQPTMKLVHKTRRGAKVWNRYDRAQTPYQRLLTSRCLSTITAQVLATRYANLNPIAVRQGIQQQLQTIWTPVAR
ncbi:MAG: integrase [bacterium]|nr:integrase [bacterium]